MKNYLIIILLLLSFTSFGQYERHGRITAKSVQLDSTWTPYNIRIGESYYDKDENTISTMLTNGVTLQNGHELFFDVINQTGATLTNGKVARFAGALGNSGKIKADYMIANGDYPAVGTIGVITEDIPNGEQGKITWFGKVRGINTTGTPYGETWNDGDTLYVHKDSLGGMTNIMPSAPDQKIWIAVVIKAHSNGTILVRPTFSTALKDLEDINGTPLDSSGQFLVWDNTNQYFDFNYNINSYVPFVGAAYNVNLGYNSILSDSIINIVHNDSTKTLQGNGKVIDLFDYSESLKLDSLKAGDATNNTEIKDDGTLVLNGTATAFNDLTFPVSTLKSVGVANKPDYDATDLGLLFPDADTTEMIGVSVQMPHAWKEGSSISPHIHIIQTSADTAIFGISYRVYNLGETVPSWTITFTYDHAYEWSSGSMLQILEFPMIDMTGKTISSQIDIKIWRRTVDNIAGDVLLKQFDIHYEIDGFGSSTEYTK